MRWKKSYGASVNGLHLTLYSTSAGQSASQCLLFNHLNAPIVAELPCKVLVRRVAKTLSAFFQIEPGIKQRQTYDRLQHVVLHQQSHNQIQPRMEYGQNMTKKRGFEETGELIDRQ